MTTIIVPDWLLWLMSLSTLCVVASVLLRLWLCHEIRKVCENRLFDQAAVLQILNSTKLSAK